MIAPPTRIRPSARGVAVGLATVILGAWLVVAFDRDYVRTAPPRPVSEIRKTVPRPDWFWGLQYPYTRFQHDFVAAVSAATVGAGAALMTRRATWTRRGLSRPGAVAVLLALAVGLIQVAVVLAAKVPMFASASSFWFNLRNNLEYPVPGTVLGAWTVMGLLGLWRPARDGGERVARLVGLGWLLNIALLVGYPLLFG